MNKPGHILTSIAFFALYQKEYHILFKIPVNIHWEKTVVYANHEFLTSPIIYFLLLGITIFGGIVPDFDLKFKHLFNDSNGGKRYLYHRQTTHSLILWTGLFFYSAYTQNIYMFYFSLGGLSHLFGDMITGSVPVLLWGKYYNYFSRIGIDRIYKNPAFYLKFANFLDKFMIIITALSIAYMLY